MANELELRLTPSGTLRLEGASVTTLRATFSSDWREGLFSLGAEKSGYPDHPTLHFWQNYARRYLAALCHQIHAGSLESPPLEECHATAISAPPMSGGEYLTAHTLADIWQKLDQWVKIEADKRGGRDALLQERAPKWRQVGRVYFHLAENKKDPDKPFAFLATYTTGLNESGKPKHSPLHKSLEQYKANREALVKLLSPIQQAAESCPWVMAMLENKEIYRPMAWPAERAYEFLNSAEKLEESGLSVLLPNWWKKRPRPRVSVTIGEQPGQTMGADALLQFDVRVALGEQTVTSQELEQLLSGRESLVQLKGQWVEVDREKLREALAHWRDLEKTAKHGEISFVEGMRLLAGASQDLRDESQHEQERDWIQVEAGDAFKDLLTKLREPENLATIEPGEGLKAELREYQKAGLSWMHLLTSLGLGACLADDMGLGKTIQVLALLLTRPKDGPSLLVVPASLLGNWRQEAERFAPSLRLLFAHPSETDRARLARLNENPAQSVNDVDLVVTTYSMLTRQEWLPETPWNLVILDEAQTIKNASSRQSQAARKLKARARVALTGTPVENRLSDLWSLFDFLNPGLLGSASVFGKFVKALQERDENKFAPLRQLVGPYILRRLKSDRSVIADLPDKIETHSYCGLTKPQVKLYERVLVELEKALKSADGMDRRGLVLQSLMQLKQICNHPSQFLGDGDYQAGHSGKMMRLNEICQELSERQERVLIFTQFREMISPLATHLAAIFGAPGLVLHGGTAIKERPKLVAAFQAEDGPPFFVLSLKAGGTGLNLTRASHVIHFDRWWNPAVENQATDRAFRIGQKANVQVHKFVTRGTLEERIDALIASKQSLAEEVLSGEGEVSLTELSNDELLALVCLDVSQASV